jgi:hypothetical protein
MKSSKIDTTCLLSGVMHARMRWPCVCHQTVEFTDLLDMATCFLQVDPENTGEYVV